MTNKEKHQVAFCISSIAFCIGLSFIATAIMGCSAVSSVVLAIGGVITFLSVCQAVESYDFLQNSEKHVTKLKNHLHDGLLGKQPESKLFIERVFEPFLSLFGRPNQYNKI